MTRETLHDIIVIGGGPAGLSAAINGEYEGLNTLVLDAAEQFGGQAGTSSCIENYAGFPGGISGKDLTARMLDQALGLNTEFLGPWRAEDIYKTDEGMVVVSDGERLLGRTVLLSMGVDFRRLVVPNLAAYLGRGVKYGFPRHEVTYESKQLVVVGGANSAGQAAVHLSGQEACEVHLLVRNPDIHAKMSDHLIERIGSRDNVHVHLGSEVVAVDGDGALREVHVRTGEASTILPADELFIMIGSEPKTSWLPGQVTKSEAGYVQAGGEITETARHRFVEENQGRAPLPHETSMPGLFVAGDVRAGSTHRVAYAAGDGANAIPDIFRYLETRTQ